MVAQASFPTMAPSPKQLQSDFLRILPLIERHAAVYFRSTRCPNWKGDCIAETVALSWRWFNDLARRGKDATQFPTTLAAYAARAVFSGRRLCGQLKAKDVLNERTQRRHGFRIERLPTSTRTAAARPAALGCI
jgi:hypothetical protein